MPHCSYTSMQSCLSGSLKSKFCSSQTRKKKISWRASCCTDTLTFACSIHGSLKFFVFCHNGVCFNERHRKQKKWSLELKNTKPSCRKDKPTVPSISQSDYSLIHATLTVLYRTLQSTLGSIGYGNSAPVGDGYRQKKTVAHTMRFLHPSYEPHS